MFELNRCTEKRIPRIEELQHVDIGTFILLSTGLVGRRRRPRGRLRQRSGHPCLDAERNGRPNQQQQRATGRDLVTQWKTPPSAGTPGVTHGFIPYEWRGFSLSESFFTEVYIAFLINLHSNVT